MTSSTNGSVTSPLRRIAGVLLVAALCLLFLTVNWITARRVAPWIDEVMQVDAGINLHLSRGWVSSAWYHQPQTQFWAANNPLYTWLIFLWVSVAGIAPEAVRTMNALLALGIAALLADLCRRRVLLHRFWSQLLLAVLVVTNSAVAYVYRMGRADLVTLAVVVLLAWIYLVVRRDGLRHRLLFLAALPVLAAGLQAIPFMVLLLALEFAATRHLRCKDLLAILAGVLAGSLLLAAIYAAKHTFLTFVLQTFAAGYNILGSAAQAVVIHDHTAISRFLDQLNDLLPWNVARNIARDPSLLPLVAFLAVALLLRKRMSDALGRLLLFACLTAVVIPYGMLAAGRYAFYYSWMGSVPVIVLFVLILERIAIEKHKALFAAGLAAAALALLLGLPYSIRQQCSSAASDSYSGIERILAAEVRPGDEIFGDPVFYYAARARGIPFDSSTYIGGRAYRHASQQESDRITLLILPPLQYGEVIAKVGGGWTAGRLYQTGYGFPLQVWRRPHGTHDPVQ